MMKVPEYLAAQLPPYTAVQVEGRMYNRPRPEGAFLTDFSNMRRYRGSRADQIKDKSQVIALGGPAIAAPAVYSPTKRGIRHETGGDWYGRSARVHGHILADGSIEVERLELASPEWEKWSQDEHIRQISRGIHEREVADPDTSDTMRRYAQQWLDRDNARAPHENPEPDFADPLAQLRPLSYSPAPVIAPPSREQPGDLNP